MITLQEGIDDFIKAQAKLREAEVALNRLVEEQIKVKDFSCDEVMEMIDRLPEQYKGARRLYELACQMEDSRYTSDTD